MFHLHISFSIETDSKNSFSRSRCIGSDPGTLANPPFEGVNNDFSKSLLFFEDIESSGTPVGIVSGTCHSYKSSWQGFMKERLKMFTTIEFTTIKV